jgi:hypothetical protein
MARNVTDCENQPAIGELEGVIPITANCRFVTPATYFAFKRTPGIVGSRSGSCAACRTRARRRSRSYNLAFRIAGAARIPISSRVGMSVSAYFFRSAEAIQTEPIRACSPRIGTMHAPRSPSRAKSSRKSGSTNLAIISSVISGMTNEAPVRIGAGGSRVASRLTKPAPSSRASEQRSQHALDRSAISRGFAALRVR